MKVLLRVAGVMAIVAYAQTAAATFHFMQIEQVIGGVSGDTTAQAIQLRMRVAGQDQVSAAKLVAYDANGLNPVTIIDIGSDVANTAGGARVLIASVQFANTQMPPGVSPDFVMTNLIPAAYLAAGRLTWESDGGVIYWSLSWGGAAYMGSTTGNTANDADGDFGPSFGAALPSTTNQALQFTGGLGAASTNNAADYSVSAGDATFTNNAGGTGTVPVVLQKFSVE